jgi:fermentation-respiration switch protein FrsA (DUF1100 family)
MHGHGVPVPSVPLRAIFLSALALYAIVALSMYLLQRSLIYRPDRARRPPSEAGLAGVREDVLTAADGARIVTWRMEAKPGKPTILYFHGNGGHLADRAQRIEALQADGYGLLMVAYRGYSGSAGSPSETANVADALLAYDRLRAEGTPPDSIVLFGESLGTGVATQVAEAKSAAALILDSPYTSFADAAQHHYWWLPARLLIVDRYDIIGRIGRVYVPLLILHGEADDVVPVAMGRAVFAAANQPKQLVTFPGAGHIHHMPFGSFERVRAFIDGLR